MRVLCFCFLFISVLAVAQEADVDSVQIVYPVKVTEPDSMSLERFVSLDTLRFRFMGDGNFARGNVNRSLMVLRAELLISV